MAELKAYQQRVIVERDELYGKTEALQAFLHNATDHPLPDDERRRMTKQLHLMQDYLHILNERITNFAS